MKNVLKECIENINNSFDTNELAFLALQGKIELQLRDKIAWLLYKQGYKNVKKEYAPQGSGRRKCDLAILDDNLTPLCLIEFKAHSSQNWEGRYKICFENDMKKMRDMASHFNPEDVQLFYIFFQTIHSKEFTSNRERTLVSYYDIINRAVREDNMPLNKQWQSICSIEKNHNLIDQCSIEAGTYLDHKIIIETMIYGPAK